MEKKHKLPLIVTSFLKLYTTINVRDNYTLPIADYFPESKDAINTRFKFCVKGILEAPHRGARSMSTYPCQHIPEVHTCLWSNLDNNDKAKLESKYRDAKKIKQNSRTRQMYFEYDYSD